MITLFIHTLRLLKALVMGLRDKETQGLFVLTGLLLLSGGIFYHNVEEWSFLDSLYFSVMTLTTVGYGDLAPVTDLGKVFTMIYVIVGIGLFLGFINKVAEFSRFSRRNSPQ